LGYSIRQLRKRINIREVMSLEKNCYKVRLKFKDEYGTHETYVGADNEHDAFMQAVSNHTKYHDLKVVESWDAVREEGTYREFLDERNSRYFD